jgi:haloacid dehalogenase-like hydrolase
VGIAAAILDLDGTLLDSEGAPVPGVQGMLSDLRSNGVRIAIASNRPNLSARLQSAGLLHDLAMDRHIAGAKKGSPLWVDAVCQAFAINTNEVVWLGDSDLDMRSAVNARIVYFNAGWAAPTYPYGINVTHPRVFDLVIKECFSKAVYWYWQVSDVDRAGRPTAVRGMIDGNGAGISALRSDLISFLKHGGNPSVGPLSVRDFMMLHLLGSILW